MIDSFTAYGRCLTVLFSCAASIFIVDSIDSNIIVILLLVLSSLSAILSLYKFINTIYRFISMAISIVPITFVAFIINKNLPETAIANVSGILLFVSLGVFTLYAWKLPPTDI